MSTTMATTTEHKPRPFSIDFSLELERQLESESLPSSPAHNADAHPHRDSLDPTVLAHIIMQLRQSLADMTKERDDLLVLVASAHSKEAELNDALQDMTDKATGMKEELSEARKKLRDDEEAINLLRSKVEESRRGLMRLQTENRRHSVQPLDMSRAGISLPFGSPPSSKRASFTPLTGNPNARTNGHKRLSSVSDTSSIIDHDANGQVITLTEPSPASSRLSGFFGRSSPPRESNSPLTSEMEVLRRELASVKGSLEETRAELSEVTEAREASETCVKALRDFITENNIGSGKVETAAVSGQLDSPTNKKQGGWGFGLWKVDTSVDGVAAANTSTSTNVTPTTATPLSRKIGGLFTRQPSISSNESITRQSTDLRSDTSSMQDVHS
ncbi:hypothetical protein E1B28_007462 [Marasmius oreades]|uniref:Uncharacterized protein n=1 Tax=Marasmius oreades TaxID=181124 RepID=A0A9P7S3F6_9AGAR|nr:uncharacterized protein E1B28_007462 [Marasmius oreades]KAG7093823.1 hypothetical protein E1B28_007462 [Marasmius oreades]